jgi:hypothetical protein
VDVYVIAGLFRINAMNIERIEERDVLGNQTGEDETAFHDSGHEQGRLMSPDHPRWEEFLDRLEGPEGRNFEFPVHGDIKSMTWTCDAEGDFPMARKILAGMGLSSTEMGHSLSYFEEHGGYCDCEMSLT